jgi:hypothetical protein
MLEVILDEDGDGGRWRLLVLEDTGELLAADAKQQTGQGLSRLLNVVDGLIGRALRVLVLVTTNEPLQVLHPAVARPGRCAAKIEFRPFGAEEATRWLRERGHPGPSSGGTVASLGAPIAPFSSLVRRFDHQVQGVGQAKTVMRGLRRAL